MTRFLFPARLMLGAILFWTLAACSQESASVPVAAVQSGDMQNMPGMQHTQHSHSDMAPTTFIDEILSHTTSGTSAQPNSTPAPMLMVTRGQWQLMLHGGGFINALQQTGPRGDDKVFATGWLMFMAHRPLSRGQLTLRLMLSPEPATVTGSFYPQLFQQGETAFGRPIIDGQHPHDFFMEIAALYDIKLGRNALLSLYAAPVGDPAMGPSAYAHRYSASEDPVATLGHHLQDSTHIAADVITAGLTWKAVRVEASGFHGREPDEHRWDIDSGKIDSWSTRLTAQFRQNWSAQYSFAHLISPEQLNPALDTDRMTASIMHNRPLARGNWATTLLWGRNHQLSTGENLNGYLAESSLRFAVRNTVWGRIENADRTTELLLRGLPEPPGFRESFLARVQAYTLGYDHDIGGPSHVDVALGGQITFYGKPGTLTPAYGSHPLGGLVFVRFRLAGREQMKSSGSDHTHHP